MVFETKVSGVPCICKVIHYRPEDPGCTWGPPENCYPSEPAEFDFTLHNVKSHSRMQWLEVKASEDDVLQLQAEYEAEVTAHKYGIED